MKEFRKKPVVIQAIQTPFQGEDPTQELITLVEENGWGADNDGILIPTLEGEHLASPGDWIIKGLAGEFYPCKPEIFAASYEAT